MNNYPILDIMVESNFSFLNTYLPELSALGGFAEQYVYPDPPASAIKLRIYAEKLVEILYDNLNLTYEEDRTFFELLDNYSFRKQIPETILSIIHFLRIQGNKAAHSNNVNSETVLKMLKMACDLGKWIYATYYNGDLSILPNFIKPKKIDDTENWKKERFDILTKLAAKEIQVQNLLIKLSKERESKPKETKSEKVLKSLFDKSIIVSDELKFTEEQTRKILIDNMLSSVGWDVDVNGDDTDEVAQEFELDGQPTNTGKGFADYVLFNDNGKALAVIEAKRTSKDANKGKTQAKLYADSLEKKYNQRPIIFYSNGYETYIWNDSVNEPPRKIYGFYSKDSLKYLFYQRNNQSKLTSVKINYDITDRAYQIESIKRVLEKIESKRRKALIALATGTGKTRIAVSLCDVLIRCNAVKRILFLCDRRELRKQAKNVFQEYLPGLPISILNNSTYKERDKRIYLATYPAINQFYQNFDIGFFDLIIADESHRSIYKAYRDIFLYFDCYQIGLTATPIDFVNRNTFRMFDCKPNDPTAYFSYEDAIINAPPYLSKFEVFNYTTKFLRDGIKYNELSKEQKIQIEEQVAEPEAIEYDSQELNRYIYNKDTNKHIVRNLMEKGLKLTDGSLGKSIIFARNHIHAIMLQEVFDELYPQYGGKFCQVIDNYDPRAGQLIDDFKGIGNNPDLTIAISVDMLDTGIDIPEILNLVFAKPIKSYVKFWQMIGRGTRICKDLFGPGKDKNDFLIFDHWGNFDWFDLHYKKADPSISKTLMQRLFEERIALANNALQKFDKYTFNIITDLILGDIVTLSLTKTISVKEHLKEIKQLQSNGVIKKFSGKIKNLLLNTIAPLMQWINIRGESDAYSFDLLITKAQKALLLNSGKFNDYKGDILNRINSLKRNLNQVLAKSETIQKILSKEFWEKISIKDLENIRIELRSIMKFHEDGEPYSFDPLSIDVTDEDVRYEKYNVKNKGLEMAAYKERVIEVLNNLFDRSLTLQKIKSGKPVNEKDIEELISLVLTQHPDLNLKLLQEFYPDTSGHLDLSIRRIIGLNPNYIDEQFTKFIKNHNELNSTQIKFIQMLKNHIAKYGTLKFENLFF